MLITPITGGSIFKESKIAAASAVWVSVSIQAKNTNSPFASSFVRSAPTTKKEIKNKTRIASTADEFSLKNREDFIRPEIFFISLINYFL